MVAKKTTKKKPKHGNTGKKNGEKFKTSAQRKALCKQWCKHLSDGFSRESFPYCDPQTFRKYAKSFPKDFPADNITQADRRQKLKWEKRLAKCADGGKGNANSIKFGLEVINKWKATKKIQHGSDPENPLPAVPAPIINNSVDLSGLSVKELKELRRIGKKVKHKD